MNDTVFPPRVMLPRPRLLDATPGLSRVPSRGRVRTTATQRLLCLAIGLVVGVQVFPCAWLPPRDAADGIAENALHVALQQDTGVGLDRPVGERAVSSMHAPPETKHLGEGFAPGSAAAPLRFACWLAASGLQRSDVGPASLVSLKVRLQI